MNGRPGYAPISFARPIFPPRGQEVVPADIRAKVALGIYALVFAAHTASAQSVSLTAGEAQLKLEAQNGTFGPALFLKGSDVAAFRQDAPLALQLDAANGTSLLQGRYSQARPSGPDTVVATGALRSANGTLFSFRDVYSAGGDSGAFAFTRQVTISSPSANDRGFATRFSLPLGTPAAYGDCEFLIPGTLYRSNTGMTPGSLAGDFQANAFFIREDRLPLPLVMLRETATGNTLLILHRNPDGGTLAGDNTSRTLTDARLQYASLGVHDRTRPSPGMWFPGSEGDRSYYGGGWAYRRHPVTAALSHRYAAVVRVSHTTTFAEAAAANWNYAFAQAPPAIRRADLARVKSAGIDLLARSWKSFGDGSAGFPFRIGIYDGVFGEYAMQMGFIGQNLPGANELLRAGLRANDTAWLDRGGKMVDFWAAKSPADQGLPRTWYDAGKGFRPEASFLRIATDGVLGALRAWRTMDKAGRPRPAWLAFARNFGDWLVSHQNADGSFYRAYAYATSVPTSLSKTNTLHPVPLLAELFRATGDVRFREAAIRAGEFAFKDVHQAYNYVGGTADNPDVRDKEAGVLSLDAFLALRDLTGDAKWLAAAMQAATYVETWTYAWPVPIPAEDDSAGFPGGRDQTGLSLISMGHSGADNFMAYGPFAFFRLYAQSGERHFLDVARFLLHNTKQGMDWDPARPLGYAYPGLQTEVGTVCAPRGHSVRTWLPWVTVVALIPMSQLEDVFGSMDVEALAAKPLEELRARDAAYGATLGYGPGPEPVSAHAQRAAISNRRLADILGRIYPREADAGRRTYFRITAW